VTGDGGEGGGWGDWGRSEVPLGRSDLPLSPKGAGPGYLGCGCILLLIAVAIVLFITSHWHF
jgi:hypothetical protein